MIIFAGMLAWEWLHFSQDSEFYPRFFSHSPSYHWVIRGVFPIPCSNEQIFLQSNDGKNPTQSETITRTVSLPAWYILEYPLVSVEKMETGGQFPVSITSEVYINQIVLRQDV